MTPPVERPKRTREQTKERLLVAARAWLLANGRANPVDIRLSDVLRNEGLTTGAAYQIWQSQDEFRRDVALHLASEFEWATTDVVGERVAEMVAAGATREECLEAAARLYFEHFVANDEYYIVLQLFSVNDPSPELTAALRRGYDLVHQSFLVYLERSFLAQGRRVLAPFELDDLAVLAAALTEGLALRHRVQPERIRTDIGADESGEGGWHLFSSGLEALSERFTELVPDGEVGQNGSGSWS